MKARAEPASCPLFQGPLAGFAGSLVWTRGRKDFGIGPEPDRLLTLLRRFQKSVDGPWQPACSLWGQIYFNALLIPSLCLLAMSEAKKQLVCVRPRFCPKTGVPQQFILCRVGRCTMRCVEPRDLADLVDAHLDHVVAQLQALTGLSRRLLWESAGRTCAWTLGEITRVDQAAGDRLRETVTDRPARSPITTLFASGGGTSDRGRRLCCLRCQIPGIAACAGICPRAQAGG